MKLFVWFIKKSEVLSALSIRLVYLTGKSKVPVHPKHLIRKESDIWYKKLLGKNKVILDVGCGSGQHSLSLTKKVKKVIGLDIDSTSLRIARIDASLRRIKNCEFLEVNLEKKILLKDNSCDLAIMFDVLEHINRRQKFLLEIKRILKRRGRALVVIPNNDTSWKRLQRKYGIFSYSDPDHKIEYTEKSIKDELLKAGFQIESIEPTSYDTPWVGFIDLVGGISLTFYKKLSSWKKKMAKAHPKDCSGFQVVAVKV